MYIDPFALGVIVGALATFIGIMIWAVVQNRRKDEKDDDKT